LLLMMDAATASLLTKCKQTPQEATSTQVSELVQSALPVDGYQVGMQLHIAIVFKA
jgi:hypothetical protein